MKAFATGLVVAAVLDYFWLGIIANSFYLEEIGHLARTSAGKFDPVIWPAVVVYFCLATGISVFVVPRSKSWSQALGLGALLGLVIYGTYDMTNLSLLNGWPLAISLIDIAWGISLCATTSVFAFIVSRYPLTSGS